MHRYRFSYWLPERPGNWAAGTVFAVVGGLILAFGPRLFAASGDYATVTLLRILGGTFLLLGMVILAWMLGDLWLGAKDSPRRQEWYWWGQFLAPMLAAAAFSVPSALMFPAFLVAYLARPNGLFPAGQPAATGNLWIGALFSLFGCLGLALMYVITRSAMKARPRLARAGSIHQPADPTRLRK
jgi:hypothetical protein